MICGVMSVSLLSKVSSATGVSPFSLRRRCSSPRPVTPQPPVQVSRPTLVWPNFLTMVSTMKLAWPVPYMPTRNT